MAAERLTADLYATISGRAMTVEVGSERRPLLRFGATRGENVEASIVFPAGAAVNVSRSPATVVSLLEEEARRCRRDPGSWSSVLAGRLAESARAWGVAADPDGGRHLGTIVLVGAHPALGPAIAAGMRPLPEVPAWASRALAQRRPRDVATALFSSTTRALTAALARLLTSPLDRRLRWPSLAIAAAAAPRLEPDDVATLLSIPAPSTDPPDTDDVTRLHHLFDKFDRMVTMRLCREALADAGSYRQLVSAAGAATDVGRSIDSERPARLDDLRRFSVATRRAAAVQAAGTPAAARAAPGWTTPRNAPMAPSPARRAGNDRVAALRGALDRSAAGDLVLEVARDGRELDAWASILDNCLASFADAVTAGRSIVVGVRRDARLVAAFEIDPSGPRLRQFVAHRNRPPAPTVTAPVLQHLRAAGVAVD